MKKLAIVGAVFLALAVLLLSHDWKSPALGRALLERAGAVSGMEITASGFRLNLLSGLVMRDVKASYAEQGREMTLSLDRLVWKHRLLPLLWGTVAIDAIVFERPRIELLEPATPARSAPAAPAGADRSPAQNVEMSTGGLAVHVGRIALRDGTIVMRQKGVEGATRVEGLDLDVRDLGLDPSSGSLAGLSGSGSLEVGKLDLGTLVMTDAAGSIQIGDGHLSVPDLRASLPHGDLTGNFDLAFARAPFSYQMAARCDSFDLAGLLDAKGGFGAASAQLDAHGTGPETRNLVASGTFHLDDGSLPAAPLFAGIDAALGKSVVVGASYSATDVRFELHDDVFHLAPFRFETGLARVEMRGTSRLEGPIDFALSVATPREGVTLAGTGGDVLDLLTDDAGWLPVPMRITGTYEAPKVRPDTQALAAQAGQGAGRALRQKAVKKLGGLFHRKQQD